MDAVRRFGVVATTLDAPVRGDIRFRPKTLLVCGADGVFESVLAPGDDSYRDVAERLDQSGDLHSLGSDTIVVPGMVDLHVHAPQWPQLGKALDVPLETWLHRYTFPLEAKYSDLDFADAVYRSLVSGLLANGTTTAVYFATIHQAATQRLAELCLELGQRAVVGKVAMDLHDACPDYYRDESAASAVAATATLIEFVRDHQANAMERVLPAVTPRFIPSCSRRRVLSSADTLL